jgi:hypothetical protein
LGIRDSSDFGKFCSVFSRICGNATISSGLMSTSIGLNRRARPWGSIRRRWPSSWDQPRWLLQRGKRMGLRRK